MDASTLSPLDGRDGSRALLLRLWREHVRHQRGRIFLVLLLTAIMAGTTALYPVLIDHAFSMFTNRDPRILYQIPALVVIVTSVKAASRRRSSRSASPPTRRSSAKA
jgi:subfamily B ATP-binding cassette protein MsbA